jgi:hypothetical protein
MSTILLVFVLSLCDLTRSRRPSRQLQELQLSTQRLITAEESRSCARLKNTDQSLSDVRLRPLEDSGGRDVRVWECASQQRRPRPSGGRGSEPRQPAKARLALSHRAADRIGTTAITSLPLAEALQVQAGVAGMLRNL